MLRASFVEFVASLFPAADPRKARKCIDDLTRKPPDSKELFSNTLPDPLYQGDIVEPVDFMFHGDGGPVLRESPGMLLSHSCDMENDEEVIFAECYAPQDFDSDPSLLGQIKTNTMFNLLYLCAVPAKGEVIVNLSQVQTVPTALLKSNLDAGQTMRVSSFTDLGYYLFIAKVTVHLLRPKGDDEIRSGHEPPGGSWGRMVGWF